MPKIGFCFLMLFPISLFAVERKIVDCKNDVIQLKISPDASQISYVQKQKRRKYSLFIKSLKNGTDEKELISKIYKRGFYSWSHDGGKIACTVKDKIKKSIVVIDVANGNKNIIGNGKNPEFSFDDKKLAYLTKKDVLVYDFSTRKIVNITNNPEIGAMNALCWTPDGNVIYYAKDGDLWKVSLTDKKNKRIINHTKKSSVSPFVENPQVNHNGKSIFYSLISDGLYAHASDNLVGKYDVNSGKHGELFEANSWSLSPDGQHIVYSLGGHIYSRNLTTDKNQKICAGSCPFFSRDGKTMVFLRRNNKTDKQEIYMKILSSSHK